MNSSNLDLIYYEVVKFAFYGLFCCLAFITWYLWHNKATSHEGAKKCGLWPELLFIYRDYTKKYFGFVDPNFMIMAVDRNDRIVGLFLGLPSLSRPFQKACGRLFPFGFLHILMGFKKYDTVDFYFAGVHPQANARKILPVMTLAMFRALKQHGVRYIETNRELENNTTLTRIWTKFSVVNKRRTRIFSKQLH